MDTSGFYSAGWRATALLFSGRPNPEWCVTDADAERLLSIWESLYAAPTSERIPALGYMGCALFDATRRWTALNGTVTFYSSASTEARHDPRRVFEHALIATAPPGAIPAGVST
jgi:hypothetical protein